MNYQTTLSGLDWSMMPSGATVPPSGIAVMASYENQLGKIVAGNGGGEKVIDLSSSNYTGSIDDTLYDYIVLSGSINSARTVSLYHDNTTQLGSKRYFLCASKQLKSTGESYNITVNSTTGGSAIYIVTTTSGFSSDTLIPIYVDNLGNVVEQSKTVPITINTSSIISYAMAAIGAGICEFGQNSNGYYFKIKLGTGTGILVCFNPCITANRFDNANQIGCMATLPASLTNYTSAICIGILLETAFFHSNGTLAGYVSPSIYSAAYSNTQVNLSLFDRSVAIYTSGDYMHIAYLTIGFYSE